MDTVTEHESRDVEIEPWNWIDVSRETSLRADALRALDIIEPNNRYTLSV